MPENYPQPTMMHVSKTIDPVLPTSDLLTPATPDLDITEDMAHRAMARLKTRCITPQIVNDFAIVGRYTKKIGVLAIVRGAMMESVTRMKMLAGQIDEWVEGLEKKRKTAAVRKDITELVRVQTEIARRLNDLSQTLIEAEGQLPPASPNGDQPKVPSFGAGQAVTGTTTVYAKEVHMHSNQGDTPKPAEPES